MFDPNPKNLSSITVAEMFRNSLAESNVQLATVPPFLILIAPRHERTQRSYRYIVPNDEITLDDKMLPIFCQECDRRYGDPAMTSGFFTCDQCSSTPSSSLPTDARIQCFCQSCLDRKHQQLGGGTHLSHRLRNVKPQQHKMSLFAVLCIEKSHYVAFVKCQDRRKGGRWLFFDSMSDQVHNKTNIPSVSEVSSFGQWLQDPLKDVGFFNNLDAKLQSSQPMVAKFTENETRRLRLIRDGAFFFYENTTCDYQ